MSSFCQYGQAILLDHPQDKEAAMQVEILKFLQDANAYMQSAASTDSDTKHLDDLQAVDRALPDSDWFELVEERDAARRTVGELWTERGADLEF
jgi:hypothetical protein